MGVNDAILKNMQASFKRAMGTLPTVVANEMVNFTKERFREQNWFDKTREPWKKRISKKDSSRAILRKSGRLARSIRPIVKGDMAGVGSDVPYAKAHNDGVDATVSIKGHQRNKYGKTKVQGTSGRMQTVTGVTGVGTVKAHTRKMKMPKRRFAGPSGNMMERLKKAAAKHLHKSLQ